MDLHKKIADPSERDKRGNEFTRYIVNDPGTIMMVFLSLVIGLTISHFTPSHGSYFGAKKVLSSPLFW